MDYGETKDLKCFSDPIAAGLFGGDAQAFLKFFLKKAMDEVEHIYQDFGDFGDFED